MRAVRQLIHADGRLTAARVRRQDQRVRVFRQFDGVQHQLQQVAVIAGIAHQHRPEQGLVVRADDKAFVDLFAFVEINIAARARRTAVGVANPTDINAQQLQLGAEIRAFKGVFGLEDMVNGNLGHFVAWRDQAKNAVVPAGAFTDGVDIRVRGLAGVVDHNTAAGSDFQTALGGQLIARADTGREDDKVDFQLAAVGKTHGFTRLRPFLNDLFGVFASVNAYAHAFDFTAQLFAAHLIQLFSHQHGSEFNHVGLNAEVFQRARGFQP